jgi:membrane protease YdiL (CAAX protease family)
LAWRYLVFTFAVSYAAWGAIILANQFGHLGPGAQAQVALDLVAGNAPAIVACVLLARAGVWRGVKGFLRLTFQFKALWTDYAAVFGLLAVAFGIPVAVGDVKFGYPLYLAVLLIPVMIPLGGLEELGWRQILQPSLERRWPFAVATVATAAIWAVWHLPLFVMKGTVQADMSFPMFALSDLGLAFALAALYRVSGNIWLCVLFHSGVNALYSSFELQMTPWVVGVTQVALIAASLALMAWRLSSARVCGARRG